MIVNYNGKVAIGQNITEAISQLFPGFSADVGEVAGGSPSDPGNPPPVTGTTAQDLLQQAEQLFTEAETALKAGDLGTYADKEAQARALVQQALDLLG
jgi:uncharacterized membrane protein (UPF0182 family)